LPLQVESFCPGLGLILLKVTAYHLLQLLALAFHGAFDTAGEMQALAK